MRLRPLNLLALAIALAFAALATTRWLGPSLHYVVRVEPMSSDRARATIRLDARGVPPGTLRLGGFASTQALRVSGLACQAFDGAALEARARNGIMSTRQGPESVPGFELQAPGSRHLVVRYTVEIGQRHGDDHVGYNGKCFGVRSPEFVAAGARSLFLVPQPFERWKDVRVRFELPEGWSEAAPWERRGGEWRLGISGDAIEHLITATLAFGRFTSRVSRHHGTTWSFVAPASSSRAEARTAIDALERTTRILAASFGRGLGPRYTVVVLPKSDVGDEVAGEGWATGQGRTLMPMTLYRMRSFVEDLVDAYVLHAPYRSTFEDRRDFWLPSALREYEAAAVLQRLGWIGEREREAMLFERLNGALGTVPVPSRLELDFDSPNAWVPAGKHQGACLLDAIDRRLRESSHGARSLDQAIASMFAGREARSLWGVLPREDSRGWADLRARCAAGGQLPALATFPALPFLRQAPVPARGPVVRTIRLALTANTGGFLEQCGCKASQSGGVAKRATLLRDLRRSPIPLAVLDAGNLFPEPGEFRPEDPFAVEEARMSLRLMREAGYDAMAIGRNELTWGERFFSGLDGSVSAPFVSSVRRRDGLPLAPASRVVDLGGVRMGIVSIFEPPRYRDAEGEYENHAQEFERPDPIPQLRRDVAELRDTVDLVCVLGRATPAFARRIVEQVPGVDVVASPEPFGFMTDPARARAAELDSSGFWRQTLVLYPLTQQYGVTIAELGLDVRHRVASARVDYRELTADVKDDAKVRRELNHFYEQVGSSLGRRAHIEGPFSRDSLRQQGRYAGATACEFCHMAEYRQWRETPHAEAFRTLLKKHRNFQPECVSCHVVAFGAPHGYRFGDPDTRLAGVQCEVCHGPAADHARSPARVRPQRGDDPAVCLRCHTPEHSNAFVYADRLPRVIHGQALSQSVRR